MDSQDPLSPNLRLTALGAASYWRAAVADRLVCAFAGAVALAVYVATLAPGVTGEDSGELIAAAWTLGIPHPPGYPLWCLLAYPILHVVDAGSVAWRGNLASALFGAAGVWILAETVFALFGRRWAALAAALALAFSREFWQQAVVAEVYTLGAALIALHWLLLIRWSRSRRPAAMYGAALVAGLAAAHYTLNLVLVPLGLIYIFVLDVRPRRLRRYGWFLALSIPGWAIYLYLPLRSLADPAMDWGNPETWPAFVDVVSRGQYRDLMLSQASFGPQLLEPLRVAGRQLAFEFTPWVGLAALAGLCGWGLSEVSGKGRGLHSPPFAVYALAAGLAFAAGALFVPEYPPEYPWEWLRTAYWIPVLVTAACFLGYIIALVSKYSKIAYIVIACICIISPIVFNFSVSNRRGDRLAEGYARELLDGMAPDAVYFGGGDHTVFPAVYLHISEGRRPDVLLANRYGYPAPELYALAGEPAPRTRSSEEEEQRLFEAVLATTARPVYSAVPRLVSNVSRVNEGLLYRYLRAGEPRRPIDLDALAVPAMDTRGDWSNELVAHEYLAALGRALFDAGRPADALDALDRAARYVHEDKDALNNLGLNAAEGGQVAAASVYFRRGLATDPLFLPAALNLAQCYLLEGAPRAALAIFGRFEAAGRHDPRLDEMKSAALSALEGR